MERGEAAWYVYLQLDAKRRENHYAGTVARLRHTSWSAKPSSTEESSHDERSTASAFRNGPTP